MPFLETMLADSGRFPYLEWHQKRLTKTLRRHGVQRTYALADLLKPPAEGRWRCRFVYDANGFSQEYIAYAPRIIKTLMPVVDETIAYRDKVTDRTALEALYARRGAGDDVLIVQRGNVTDTTIANVAFRIDGAWLTPEAPLLEGTARARLLAAGKIFPAKVTLALAMAAERVAVMNALSGFVEVNGGILPPNRDIT